MNKLVKNIYIIKKFIKFTFILLFCLNNSYLYSSNIRGKENNLNLKYCNWIPLSISKKKNTNIRYCITNKNNIYEVSFNLKKKKIKSKKFIGILNQTMTYKGRDLLDQNQDTLIKVKTINGKLLYYKCIRKTCKNGIENYQILGIKKFLWGEL